ncbi:hypothetical protein HPP92_026709 [Vanilla planifolia]|uniref:Kinesin motor domain-containing protein n=1 Tax=Vanilla planifolia TaxID=51239 RepID=A0A835PDM7_VANPL|nr:hypothetical protein HPP92_026709 [Vanilla planifolia]
MNDMGNYIKRLMSGINWYINLEDCYLAVEDELNSLLESEKRKHSEIESQMNSKIKELTSLTEEYQTMKVSLEENLRREESNKLADAIMNGDTISKLQKEKNALVEIITGLTDQASLLRNQLENMRELKGNIRVFCRVRPFLSDVDARGTDGSVISYPTSVKSLGRGIDLMYSAQKYCFTFDKVFAHESSQDDVFVEISQLVQSALDGYKPEAPEQKGLIPRSLEQIFETSQSLQCQGWTYKIQASMLEIYTETIRDLLSPNRSTSTYLSLLNKQYTIMLDSAAARSSFPNVPYSWVPSFVFLACIHLLFSGFWWLTEYGMCMLSFHLPYSGVPSCVLLGWTILSVGKTQMNEQSSRSHFVSTLRISETFVDLTLSLQATEEQGQGVLDLTDLAGSERLAKSGSTGDRLKENQARIASHLC